MNTRKFRVNWQSATLLVLFCLAIALRVFLAYQNWPLPNSDEGTMGLIGMHIRQGKHPVIYYDQDYMGVLQAYLGAVFFTLFGRSVFTLRLGMVTLFVGFLLSMYLLIRQLYARRFALFIVAIFSFGSAAMLSRQLIAIGGYPETVFFATLSLALGLRLALTTPDGELWQRARRYGLFFLWGITVSLGIWSNTLILPWVACSSLLLLFSWRELIFKAAMVAVIAGLLVGGAPLIVYNIHAPIHHDTISVLLSQLGHAPLTLHTLKAQFQNTFTISLPIMSGSPICYKSEYSFLQYWGFGNYWHSYCATTNSIWSTGFIILTATATGMACWTLAKHFFPLHLHTLSAKERSVLIINCARLILILGIVATILPYLRSSSVLSGPGQNARYLIGVWIGLPALVWPLWSGANYYIRTVATHPAGLPGKIGAAFCLSSLALLLFISMYGSYRTLLQVPVAQEAMHNEQELIQSLQSHKLHHLYADYWICYRINFEMGPSVNCASAHYEYPRRRVFDYSNNKYAPYLKAVLSDPYATYLLNQNNKVALLAVEKKFKNEHFSYQIYSVIPELLAVQPIKHT
ncbi:ArnT family glycosyltransferase [Dictyobacter formicarum]|uniref:ArnT family glycosyltransferase n=1 Tax=Dictyobacter formicarum TaxID=2778368 RepID=UPI001916C365|nr:hypothetical protein [Dictyobacter formicarum]